MISSTIRFANIILAALLAGTSFGIWIGFNPLGLSASTYLEQQQNTINSLSVLMTSLVIIATVITIISAFVQKNDKRVFITLLFAAVFFIACILISAIGNRPIDNEVMTWTKGTMPKDWTNFRDKWWSLHIMRTIAELIALILIAWTNVRSKAMYR
ncbi:MAG: DUF1772 domain-containing protein [Ginsengibacter sp.]